MSIEAKSDDNPIKLQIKNMVCPRCIRVVREELLKLGVTVYDVQLGEALVEINNADFIDIEEALIDNGFELLTDKEEQIVEKIKNIIIQLVRQDSETEPTMRNSDYIAQKIGMSYSSISKIFFAPRNHNARKIHYLTKIRTC